MTYHHAIFDFGEAAAFSDEDDPEVAKEVNDMQTGLASQPQSGFTEFVKQHKAQWEAARQNNMQVVEANKAKKRKSDAVVEASTPERTSPAATTTPSDTATGLNAPLLPATGGQPPLAQ